MHTSWCFHAKQSNRKPFYYRPFFRLAFAFSLFCSTATRVESLSKQPPPSPSRSSCRSDLIKPPPVATGSPPAKPAPATGSPPSRVATIIIASICRNGRCRFRRRRQWRLLTANAAPTRWRRTQYQRRDDGFVKRVVTTAVSNALWRCSCEIGDGLEFHVAI